MTPSQPSQPHTKPDASPCGCSAGWRALWELGPPFESAGEVNITISTEAINSEELCGNEEPVVPAQGRVDTVIKPLLVQVRWVMEEGGGMGAEQFWGRQQEDPSAGSWEHGMLAWLWGRGEEASPFS